MDWMTRRIWRNPSRYLVCNPELGLGVFWGDRQSFQCTPRLIQIGQESFDHVAHCHVVDMPLSFFCVGRHVLQTMLVIVVHLAVWTPGLNER